MKTKDRTNKFSIQITLVNGRTSYKLSALTQRKLTAAAEILSVLYEHDQDDATKLALEGVRTVCLRHCVHDVQKTLPIVSAEETVPDVS